MGFYRYFGVVLGKTKALLALLAVGVPAGGHAAVWLGASTPNARIWVQAGILQQFGDTRPYLYIETGRGGRQTSINEWPGSLNERVTVRLTHRGDWWHVTIAGHRSPPVRVPNALKVATLETLGVCPFPTVAFIDYRIVRSVPG